MTTVIGNSTPAEQGIGRIWNTEDGESQTHTWIGEATAIEAKFETLKSNPGNYGEITFAKMKGKGTLTAKVNVGVDGDAGAPSSEVTTIYEMVTNDIYKPIESSPFWTDITAARTAEILFRVQNGYTTGQRYHDGNLSNELEGQEISLYNHLAQGSTEYLESGYVLRRTQRGAKESALDVAYDGVNTVVAPPNASTINPIISSLPDGEWLKRPPTVTSLSKNRYQISEEWWYAVQWSVVYGGTLYPVPV
ncbi:hypothetical protein N9204_00385 [bacterium]|nr:hypothetical protein [bacterium]